MIAQKWLIDLSGHLFADGGEDDRTFLGSRLISAATREIFAGVRFERGLPPLWEIFKDFPSRISDFTLQTNVFPTFISLIILEVLFPARISLAHTSRFGSSITSVGGQAEKSAAKPVLPPSSWPGGDIWLILAQSPIPKTIYSVFKKKVRAIMDHPVLYMVVPICAVYPCKGTVVRKLRGVICGINR